MCSVLLHAAKLCNAESWPIEWIWECYFLNFQIVEFYILLNQNKCFPLYLYNGALYIPISFKSLLFDILFLKKLWCPTGCMLMWVLVLRSAVRATIYWLLTCLFREIKSKLTCYCRTWRVFCRLQTGDTSEQIAHLAK